MGLYNNVNYKCVCPNPECQTEVTAFQTKDPFDKTGKGIAPYENVHFGHFAHSLEVTDVVTGFYADCPKCDWRIEFQRKPAKSVDDFQLWTFSPAKWSEGDS